MEIQIQCPFCRFGLKNKPLKEGELPRGKSYNIIPNPDDNIVIIDCASMHASVVYFKNKKYDLLFESSLKAIKDYYYRESVASMGSALERFYEYCIEILLIDSIAKELYNETWKIVRNQSERQFGAFVFLYTNEFKELPNMLSSNLSGFRNKVIHKGYFPTYEETLEFNKNVYLIISNIYSKIRKHKEKSIIQYDKKYFNELKIESIARISNYSKGYIENPESNNFKVVIRPFSRIIPTFLSDIFNQLPNEDLMKNYVENTMTKTID